MRVGSAIRGLLGRFRRVEQSPPATARGPVDHIVIIDGTLSTLKVGYETNAGQTYKFLSDVIPPASRSIHYQAGIQWQTWQGTRDVIEGRGINRQIRAAYGFLATRYRPGDRIFLFGYSRGAYAVRSLAGAIDRIGLVRTEEATERAIRLAYRHYQHDPDTDAARAFARRFCHDGVDIEMIGCWDTVKALGTRFPLGLGRPINDPGHDFHDDQPGMRVRHAYHALAFDERRTAYTPVLWRRRKGWPGEMVQMWFPGTHGDVGGQLSGFFAARPLGNLSLVWMLERAEGAGLHLPQGWRMRFPCDMAAPSMGGVRGWGVLFIARQRRMVGTDPSEVLHPAIRARMDDRPPILPGAQSAS